jgi:hypothetical protein
MSCWPAILLRNAYFTFFVVFFLLTRTTASTVIVAITPAGIVTGADGKIIDVKTGSGTFVKVVLLKHKYIVGNINTETAKASDTGRILYAFPRWVSEIDKKTIAKVSVTELSTIIKNDIPSTFKFLIDMINSGQVTEENARSNGLEPDSYIVQYIVAGYERGGAVVHQITLLPDWEKHTVKDVSDVLLYPKQGKGTNPYLQSLGQHKGIDGIQIANSDQQRELRTRIPLEFGIMLNGGTFNLQQASNAVRSILAIEIEAEPDRVGFPITVITVPKVGRSQVMTYKADAFPLSALPKPSPTKPKK